MLRTNEHITNQFQVYFFLLGALHDETKRSCPDVGKCFTFHIMIIWYCKMKNLT